MSIPVLQVSQLTKRYREITAVNALSLDVYEGEIFGFLGPNGAGKTTSINMMCGLLSPDAGQVLIQGQPLRRGSAGLRAKLGVCPQAIVLWERLTCLEQLQFVGEMYGMHGGAARQSGLRLLEELGLQEKVNKQSRTLSGGMQRRLNLAMALVHDPEVLFLDEPEAGLDPQSRLKVREYIHSLARRKTVILTTHNMDEADRVVDRLAIIDHGELLVLDTPEALKGQMGPGDLIEISLPGTVEAGQVDLLCQKLAQAVEWVEYNEGAHVLRLRARHATAHLPVILEILQETHLTPGAINLRPSTLEDVFIRLTGRSLRE